MSYDDLYKGGLVFLILLVVFGLIGNVLSIIVFHRGSSCRKSRCALYFKALAVADIYVLLFPCMEYLLICLPNSFFFSTINSFTCKLATFNAYFAVEVSTWLTVAVTIDRMLSVAFPLKFSNNTGERWIYIKISAIVLIFGLINTYQLVVYRVIDLPDGGKQCNTAPSQYVDFFDIVSIGLFIFILPLLINGTCNIFILRQMYKRATTFRSQGVTESQTAARLSQAQSVTYRVVAICLVHFLSTAPFSALYVYMFVNEPSDAVLYVYQILNFMYYLNSGINFVFYVATGRDFRRDLAGMCSTDDRNINTSVNTITTTT